MRDKNGNEMLRVFKFCGYNNRGLLVAAKTKKSAREIAGNKFSHFASTFPAAEKDILALISSCKGIHATGKPRVI